jgi:hypothetical protein
MAQRLEGADGGDVRHHFPAPNSAEYRGHRIKWQDADSSIGGSVRKEFVTKTIFGAAQTETEKTPPPAIRSRTSKTSKDR